MLHPQPSVRTRRSNSAVDDATFTGILNWFSSSTTTKNIVKKIRIEVIQLLLAHGFQVIIFKFVSYPPMCKFVSIHILLIILVSSFPQIF